MDLISFSYNVNLSQTQTALNGHFLQWALRLFVLEQGTNVLRYFEYNKAIAALIFIRRSHLIVWEVASEKWRKITPSKKFSVSILVIHPSISS